jgi:hypothetical protein
MAPAVHNYSRRFAREPNTLQKAAGTIGKAAQIGGALATIGGVTRALGPQAGAVAAEVLKGGDNKPPSGGSRVTQGSGPDYEDVGGRGEDLALDIWGEGTVYPDDSSELPTKGGNLSKIGNVVRDISPLNTTYTGVSGGSEDISNKVANALGYKPHEGTGKSYDTGLEISNPFRRGGQGYTVKKAPDPKTGERAKARFRSDRDLGLSGLFGMPLRPRMARLPQTLQQIHSNPYLFTGADGGGGHHGLLSSVGGALANVGADIVAPELAIPAQIIGGAGRFIGGLHPMHLLEGGGRFAQSAAAIGSAMAQQAVGDTSDLLGLTAQPAVASVRSVASALPGIAKTGVSHMGTASKQVYNTGAGTRPVAAAVYATGANTRESVDQFLDKLRIRFGGHPQTDEPNVDDRTNMSANVRVQTGQDTQGGSAGLGALVDSKAAEGVAFVQPSMPNIESIKKRFYPVTEIPDRSGHVSGVSLDPARGTTTWNLQGKGGQTSPYTYHTPEPVMEALTGMADEGTLNQESLGGLHNTLIGKGGFNPAWGKDKDLGQMIEAMESEKARRAAAKDAGKRTRSFKSPYGSLMQRIPKEELSKYGYGEQSESDDPWS